MRDIDFAIIEYGAGSVCSRCTYHFKYADAIVFVSDGTANEQGLGRRIMRFSIRTADHGLVLSRDRMKGRKRYGNGGEYGA